MLHSPILRIHFGRGERPHQFWVGPRTTARSDRGDRETRWIKILSKRLASGAVEVVVVDDGRTGRRALARATIASDAPSGALAHWVSGVADEMGIALRCFDLRDVRTSEQWTDRARQLGWLRS